MLAGHYANLILRKEGDADTCDAQTLELAILSDWACLKRDLVSGDIGLDRVKNDSFSEFWKHMREHYKPRYPWFLVLVLIARLVPIGSAECERMFSLMNRLKTDLRNRMNNSRLNDLMTVIRLAPGLDKLTDEELDEWIDVWESGCRSGRYTSYFK